MIPQSGRFLVDVNVGGMVATTLRQAGHDVVFVGEVNPRMPDLAILTLATQERRIIITLDNDLVIWSTALASRIMGCCCCVCQTPPLPKRHK